jgi:hypothetical protein
VGDFLTLGILLFGLLLPEKESGVWIGNKWIGLRFGRFCRKKTFGHSKRGYMYRLTLRHGCHIFLGITYQNGKNTK